MRSHKRRLVSNGATKGSRRSTMPCTSACMRSCPSKLGSSASSSRCVSAALAFLAVGMRSLSLFWWPQGLEAKEKERVWVRNQNAGELDDTKLVDGATGERNIFKKRGNNNPMFGNVQMHPKRAINSCCCSMVIHHPVCFVAQGCAFSWTCHRPCRASTARTGVLIECVPRLS